MGAKDAPETPQNVGARIWTRFGWLRRGRARSQSEATLRRALPDPSASDDPPEEASPILLQAAPVISRDRIRWRGITIRRPSAFGTAILAVALAVAFLGALSYYGARKFSRDAADVRASGEAASLAEQSAFTATGDAFNGYLQMLRYADDPAVRSMTSTGEQRVNALQQLLYLNTNKLSALAIVARDGTIFASTDPAITDVRQSSAFNRTRASLAPTNSDIILPEDGSASYVEFTTPLRMPDGAVWAILYGRADPDVLWKPTLRTSVDGSRNVIINSEGLFAAGVPRELKRQPWRGAPLENGSVRADIVGVDSICGLGPIGRGSQIDHGWHVASCLPISLVQREAGRAMGHQALVTAAGAVLAVVAAAGALWFVLNGAPAETYAETPEGEAEAEDEMPPSAGSPAAGSGIEGIDTPPGDDGASEPTAPLAPVVVADVDALRLIEAYERRAARISERLREGVQARLLIAATQAQEAYRLREVDPERSEELHGEAIAELDAIRDRGLRAIGQEMYPALVRLGLGGALRALAKEIDPEFELRLEVDVAADGASSAAGRVAIEGGRRLVVFRAARAAIDALRAAGASACDLALTRDGDWLRLRVEARLAAEALLDEHALGADAVAFGAYGGQLSLARHGERAVVSGELPAPAVALPADSESDPSDGEPAEDEAASIEIAAGAPPPLVTFAAPLHGPGESLGEALRELARDLAGVIRIELDAPDAYDSPSALDAEVAGSLRTLAGAATQALADAGASSCRVIVRRAGQDTHLTITAEGADAFSASTLEAAGKMIESAGGMFSSGRMDGSVTISAVAPGLPPEDDDLPAVVQVRLAPVEVAEFEIADGDPEIDLGPLFADDEASGSDAA